MSQLNNSHTWYVRIFKSAALAYDHLGNPDDCYVKAEFSFDKELTQTDIEIMNLNKISSVLSEHLSLPEESFEVISKEEYYKNLKSCRRCGCTDIQACEVLGERCYWVEEDLCSMCNRLLQHGSNE